MSPEEAKALIEQERQERADRCKARIDQVLAEERCVLDVAITITGRGNIPRLDIIVQD